MFGVSDVQFNKLCPSLIDIKLGGDFGTPSLE